MVSTRRIRFAISGLPSNHHIILWFVRLKKLAKFHVNQLSECMLIVDSVTPKPWSKPKKYQNLSLSWGHSWNKYRNNKMTDFGSETKVNAEIELIP